MDEYLSGTFNPWCTDGAKVKTVTELNLQLKGCENVFDPLFCFTKLRSSSFNIIQNLMFYFPDNCASMQRSVCPLKLVPVVLALVETTYKKNL